MKKPALLIALAMGLSGCKGDIISSKTPLNTTPRPLVPRPAADVEIFTTTTPTRPFVEIARMRAADQSCISCPKNTEDELLTRLRDDAGRAGCDGLVMENEKRAVAGGYGGGAISAGEYTAAVRGICIVYQ